MADKTRRKAQQARQVERQLPEQKPGDTPAPPWQQPTPEQKAAARPVRKALTEALAHIDSEARAEQVIDKLERKLGDVPAEAVVKATPEQPVEQAARQVRRAAKTAPPENKPEAALTKTAQVIEAATGREREALAEAVQEVFSPEQQGAPGWYDQQREYLRRALLHRLRPLEALDAGLFIRVNHLPHSHFTNGFFYFITFIFNGGLAWYVLMGAAMLFRRTWDRRMFRASAIPLTIATALVEHPIKWLFRRRRPFITIVRAIVIGKKPGTWSFPSGHSASAFAGAWLLRQHFPALSPILYSVAALIAFSRIYLGDHYPGDVVSGSLLGHFFAMFFGRQLGHRRPRRRRHA